MTRKSSSSEDLLSKGHIIAFEGPSELLSTQLRLLPASPHILVLPTLQTYLPPNLPLTPTTPSETYLHHIHNAAAARYDAAVDFIRSGSPEAKRLVFLNGGTARAYAMVIQHISSEHSVAGNISVAEAHFRELLGGNPIPPITIAMPPPPPMIVPSISSRPSSASPELELDDDCFGSTFEERMVNVMLAAQALDEKTSDLQSEPYSACSPKPRPRSMSLPVYGFTDRFGDLAAFYMFGSPLADLNPSEASEVYTRVTSVFPGAMADPEMSPRANPHERPLSPTETVSSDRSLGRDSCVAPPPPVAAPREQQNVTEWAAGLRSLLPVPAKAPQRSRSLQFAPPPKNTKGQQYVNIQNQPPSTPPSKLTLTPSLESSASTMTRAIESIRPVDTLEMSPGTKAPQRDGQPLVQLHSPEFSEPLSDPSPPRFRACFASDFGENLEHDTAIPTIARRDSRRNSHRSSRRTSAVAVAAARRESRKLSALPIPLAPTPSTKNLLPFTEDMVIFFRDESHDNLLERVISHFQTGSFPCTARIADARRPSVPRVVVFKANRPTSFFIPTPVSSADGPRRASSPHVRLSKEQYDFGGSLLAPEPQETSPLITDEHLLSSFPPTPVHTPPIGPALIPENLSGRVHVLPVSSGETEVAVQNGLRAVLAREFPVEESGYQRFPLMLPELNGLWKPVFRETEGQDGTKKRQVDSIIALGAQSGVDKAFAANISRKLEKLGTKPSGESRAGRLDLRYLIINAMQAFTSQRLLYQTEDNPFTNPYLLASLVIPHLEIFLAAHSHIQYLLLDYPADHLPTILIIQKMIGSSIMRVAQILDPTSEKPTFSPLVYHPSSPSYNCPSPPSPTSTLTRANLLLSASASPSEIDSFLTTITAALSAIDPFYEPADYDCPPLYPAARTPIKGSYSPFPRRGSTQSTHTLGTPLTSTFKLSRPPKGRAIGPESIPRNISPATKLGVDATGFLNNESATPRSTSGSVSRTGSVAINVTEWNGQGDNSGDGKNDDDGEDTEESEENDGGLEADERRLVPAMFMRRRSARVRPNSKAMKFLGLA